MRQRGILIIILAALGTIVMAAGAGYLWYKNDRLSRENAFLKNEIAKFRAESSSLFQKFDTLRQQLGQTQSELEETKIQRLNFEELYLAEKAKMEFLASRIEDIRGDVGRLEKLAGTDPELLKKYSKVYFLNENYVPAGLEPISSQYIYNPQRTLYFYIKTLPFLDALMKDAESSGIDIKILSAFRSFGEQSGLKSSYKTTFGAGANRFSADQGYSEHQLGTVADFTTSKLGDNLYGFEKTEAYRWLTENAHKHGFVLSYPPNNPYYVFEPWHWRFIGRKLAQTLRDEGKYFYDLDQREIDKYLEYFFE